MPNSYVNDDGKPNLNNSNVQNDNNGRVAVRYVRLIYERLLRQPPIWRRASLSLAWIFSILVSLASLSSKIALSFKAVNSADASALIRYVAFIGLGACLAKMSCSKIAEQLAIAGSPRL